MRVKILGTAVMTMVLVFGASANARTDYGRLADAALAPPDLAYVIHVHLWLRSLQGNSAWPVSTPWPVSGISWSPDVRSIAIQGGNNIGVVALRGHTGQIVFTRRLYNCCGADLSWSPNGRYLRFAAETRSLWLVNLWLWDRNSGRSWVLARGATAGFGEGAWAHDSTRIALAVGADTSTFTSQRNPIAEIEDIRTERITRLGKGVPGDWSSDDRFLGFDRLRRCGATGCFVKEGIISSSGGPVTVLDRNVRFGWLTDEAWVPRPYGYGYDRWLLGPHGHVLRRLVPRVPAQFNQVEAWSPDGNWVTAKWVAPSYRVVLTLVNTDAGRSRRIYVSAPTGGCDACINQAYEVTWNHASNAFAMLTPDVGGTPVKEVYPRLYIYALDPGRGHRRLTGGHRLFHPNPMVLGWVNHDREIILYSGHAVFRYFPGRRRFIPIVRGLPFSLNYYANGNGSPVALRPGA